MPIFVNDAGTEFHLLGGSISYIIRKLPDGRLCHLYFGPRLEPGQPLDYLLRAGGTGYSIDGEFSPSVVPMEYPAFGTGDLREPCLIARDAQGRCCADLRLESWQTLPGKPMPAGLPAAAMPMTAKPLSCTAGTRCWGCGPICSIPCSGSTS